MAYHGRAQRERAGLISFVAGQKRAYPIQSLYDTRWKEDVYAGHDVSFGDPATSQQNYGFAWLMPIVSGIGGEVSKHFLTKEVNDTNAELQAQKNQLDAQKEANRPIYVGLGVLGVGFVVLGVVAISKNKSKKKKNRKY
jgi:hypothetical protein